MSDESIIDEQSHYEISLTAGQAFVAFVLLLLSLAASFAFGLMIGRGQGDDRLVVKKEPSVVTEASVVPKKSGKIVELGLADDDFKNKATQTDTASTASPLTDAASATSTDTAAAPAASVIEPVTPPAEQAAAAPKPVITPVTPPQSAQKAAPVQKSEIQPQKPAAAAKVNPVYAQLLSTGDQKTAESLAAKVINAGFTSAYVDRSANDKGPLFRVRVRFPSETDARAAEAKLREFAKDVWIVK